MMRDAALIHAADVEAAKKTGVCAGLLLPEGLTPGELERGQEFAHRTELVRDDALRAAFQSFRCRMSSQALGPRDLASGESAFCELIVLRVSTAGGGLPPLLGSGTRTLAWCSTSLVCSPTRLDGTDIACGEPATQGTPKGPAIATAPFPRTQSDGGS